VAKNRKRTINTFIGNISNTIVHHILEEAIESKEIKSRYKKERSASYHISERNRKCINPKNAPLKDHDFIRKRITCKVRSELILKIDKGYSNIDLDRVDEFVDMYLLKLKVI